MKEQSVSQDQVVGEPLVDVEPLEFLVDRSIRVFF